MLSVCKSNSTSTEHFLLMQNGLAYLSYTAFFSLASVYFVNVLNYSFSLTAVMLIYTSLVMRTTRVLFAPILDLISFNIAFPYSLLLCSLGFIALGFVSQPVMVAIAILPIGIGYGVNNILIKYAISEIKDDTSSLHRFARFGISVNVGAALGPLIGNLFIANNYQLGIAIFCALIFFMAFLVALVIIKNTRFYILKQPWSKTIIKYVRQTRFRNYFIFSFMGWFFYSQLISSYPLFMSETLHAKQLVGIIFFINALISIVLPIKVITFVQRYFQNELSLLNVSFFLYALGFLILTILPNLYVLFASVTIVSLGEIIMLPTLNAYLTKITSAEERIIGFTLSAIIVGFGEGAGSFVGTYAIKMGERFNQLNLPFLIITITSITFLVYGLLIQKKSVIKGESFG